jgi:RNA polymerase sigma-70 factor, ECF subfamily
VPASDVTAIFPQQPVEISAANSAMPEARDFSFADTPRLTAALARGDEDAFRFLHAQWNARLSRYCFALAAGEEAIATELAQAVYLRIFKHIRNLPNEEAVWSWITRAARSAACDSRRVGGRYRRALARFGEWLRCRLSRDSDEDPVTEALDAALQQLDSENRALIEARYFERVPLEQIGARLGVSTRAIEGRLARLRAHLKQRILNTTRESLRHP